MSKLVEVVIAVGLALMVFWYAAGCSVAPSDDVVRAWAELVKQMGNDKASWCFYDTVQGWGATVTHSWYRVGEGQTVDCTAHNLKAQPPAPAQISPSGAVISPNGDVVLPTQPRVFRRTLPAPILEDVTP